MRHGCLLIGLSIAFLSLNGYAIDLRLTISPTAQNLGQQVQRVKSALQLANFSYEIIELPAEQALAYVRNGQFDGLVMRHQEAVGSYSELVQVPEALARIDYWVFTRSQNQCPSDIADLLNAWKPISVKGILILNTIYKNSILDPIVVATLTDAFSVLLKGTADYIVLPRGFDLSRLPHVQRSIKFCFDEPLYSSPLFMYLHVKHRDKTSTIAKQLASKNYSK